MAYPTQESSPLAEMCDPCCICDKVFSNNAELANHLLDHANENKFKILLDEHVKKKWDPPVISDLQIKRRQPEFVKRSFFREPRRSKKTPVTNISLKTKQLQAEFRTSKTTKKRPLKKKSTPLPPPVAPEVWEIVSDDDEENQTQPSNSTTPKLSNSFRLVSDKIEKAIETNVTQESRATKNELSNIFRLVNNQTGNAIKPKNRLHSTQRNFSKSSNVVDGQAGPCTSKAGPTFNCHPCGTVFNDAEALRKHLKTHQVLFCHICKVSFMHKTALRKHLYMHIGDRSHKCSVCDKKFSVKSILLKHERRYHFPATSGVKS